jgi:L-threonylcarbamoyladenylate synthase
MQLILSNIMIGKEINIAANYLKEGKLVAIPTETVYGLAANAFNLAAVLSIFEAKNRPTFNPLIVHCANIAQIEDFVTHFSPNARKLAAAFMPGPLTLLLPKKENIHDLITAGSEKVAIRIPNHALTLELLAKINFPLTAPSANPFGYISPTSAKHVAAQLGEKVPYILDGGECTVGIESTIVGFTENDEVQVYRLGGLSVEEIEKIVGRVEILPHSEDKPATPGRLLSHYAPKTPFYLGNIAELWEKYADKKVGILAFSDFFEKVPIENQLVLSEKGLLEEAARNLFAALRRLDALNVEVILAEFVPNEGLGRAINDRLKRAAA